MSPTTSTTGRLHLRSFVVLAALVAVCGGVLSGPASTSGATSPPGLVRDPASMVNLFAGTGTGGTRPGSIGEFSGAATPFGMIQWSPDTTPDRTAGSGYAYGDHRIAGFSLTHLSGTGCPSYGDVPILPTSGPLGSDPAEESTTFSHGQESATPGRYRVSLGDPAVTAALTVTTRTGLARFTFPPGRAANVLFKVGDSAAGAQAASVQVEPDGTVVGEVTSGAFCQTGTSYTLHFVARFDRPLAAAGTYDHTGVRPGSTQCTGRTCGAYVTLEGGSGRDVLMKVGVSFVSEADAAANLAAEDPGWSMTRVEDAATGRWNALLGRMLVGGGTEADERTFYTALYHSLLHPNLVSDVNGSYPGTDGQTHTAPPGGAYANFSEWDIYRSEMPLISLLAPGAAGAMVQSLVDDASQDGWLPKWAIVGGDASQMNGDSADPIIASAYAFGVRGFDASAALAAMVKGATETEPPQGLEIERQYLADYLANHYVPAEDRDLDSIDYTAGASMTLEYSLDDFAVAQMAGALGQPLLAASMMTRAHNWEYLFNPATGYVQGRRADGTFPPGPAFNRTLDEPGGEQGFEEGNAIQYTWAVPQDLFALAALMGGNAHAVAKLDDFFAHLNAGRYQPFDWSGNEPDLWSAWEYDYFGAPWRAQDVVRRIMVTEYRDAPVNEPGNDDLGALSSWYVWAALGLYPVTPGTADLALAAPLFPKTVLTLPSGHHLVLVAPGASDATPYIQRISVSATSVGSPTTGCSTDTPTTATSGRWSAPWLPARILQTGATVQYRLGSSPDRSWGTSAAVRPPSYTQGRIPSVGFTRPSGGLAVRSGATAAVALGVQAVKPGGPPVTWQASASPGLTLSANAGTLPPSQAGRAPPGRCPTARPASSVLRIEPAAPGTYTVTIALQDGATALPPVVLAVHAT